MKMKSRDQYLAEKDAKAFIDAMKGIVVKNEPDGDAMLDITLPHHVEIRIASRKDKLGEERPIVWVNVDGVCRLRICRVLDDLSIVDERH